MNTAKVSTILFATLTICLSNSPLEANSNITCKSQFQSDSFEPDTAKVAPNDSVQAPPKIWTYSGNLALTLSQVSLTNWVAGGENAISGNGAMSLAAKYKKNKSAWDNTLDLGYGLTRQGKDKKIKNDDRIDISTKYGRNASKKWYYSVMLGFKTQFDKGYKTPTDTVKISDFLSPGYVILSVGMDYKTNDHFSMMLAPASGRLTIVNSPYLSSMEAFGVDSSKSTRVEMGGYVKLLYNKKLWKDRIETRNKIELFSNYMDKPKNVDVTWEFGCDFKISDYIIFKFQLISMYDDDSKVVIDGKSVAKLQIKEYVGLGYSYKF